LRKVPTNNGLLIMATKEAIKKDVKAGENRPKMSFAFDRKNYMFLLIGLVLLVVGFLTLSGGGSKDPNVFSTELFSTQRMVVAPILLILGYAVVAYAIMIRPKPENEEAQ